MIVINGYGLYRALHMFVDPLTELTAVPYGLQVTHSLVTNFGLGRSLYTMTIPEKEKFMRVRNGR
jgi:hypothetical protein